MFGLNVFQLILVLLFTEIIALDSGPQTQFIGKPVIIGAVLGLILGDFKTGMFIGGTLQLMSMGVVGLGGASVPNYVLTTIITVIVAISGGAGYEIGLAVGLPVGMLYVNLDVARKVINGRISQAGLDKVTAGDIEGGLAVLKWHYVVISACYLLPVIIVLLLGQPVVEAIVSYMPAWLFDGMKVAGKILPVTGMAMLLNYMPVKKNILYLIIGFVMYAYMGVPTLGVGLIGVGLAIKYYNDEMKKGAGVATTVPGGMEDE